MMSAADALVNIHESPCQALESTSVQPNALNKPLVWTKKAAVPSEPIKPARRGNKANHVARSWIDPQTQPRVLSAAESSEHHALVGRRRNNMKGFESAE